MGNLVSRWFATGASLIISIGLATLVFVHLPDTGLLPAGGPWFVARGTGEMMLYLLPLWVADLLGLVVPAAAKWLRLVCGAIGLGIGVAGVLGLAMARGGDAFLEAIAGIYFALGAYNCWLSLRQSTAELPST